MNKMLSYPFFRGKGDISFSERIENNIFSVALYYFSFVGW
mgnify:FL=1